MSSNFSRRRALSSLGLWAAASPLLNAQDEAPRRNLEVAGRIAPRAELVNVPEFEVMAQRKLAELEAEARRRTTLVGNDADGNVARHSIEKAGTSRTAAHVAGLSQAGRPFPERSEREGTPFQCLARESNLCPAR